MQENPDIQPDIRLDIQGGQGAPAAQTAPSEALRQALSWPVAKRSLGVMVVVGSVLNLINQGDVLWADAAVDWPQLALTFCVPFCVATYGAYGAIRQGRP